MADFQKPHIYDSYSVLASSIRQELEDLAKMYDGVSVNNCPEKVIRWSPSGKRFEQYISGNWTSLCDLYDINVKYLSGKESADFAVYNHLNHLSGQADEVDGDKVNIDYVPNNYIRNMSHEFSDRLEQISSHFLGIADKLTSMPSHIPSGKTILFEKDTVVTGYTLLTDVDDSLVYITKGSAVNGNTGDATKSASTWTQPNHNHSGFNHRHSYSSHTHSMPTHNHKIIDWGGVNTHEKFYDSDGNIFRPSSGGTLNGLFYGKDNLSKANHDNWFTSNKSGSTTETASADTGYDGTGDTSDVSPANTWRPLGRVFTRQTRN